MKKKITSVLIAMIVFAASMPVTSMVYADDASNNRCYDGTIEERILSVDEETGLVTPNQSVQPSQQSEPSDDTLPDVYQTIDEVVEKYPGTRDQGIYGACWAFAVTACAEFNMVKKGIYTKEQADFSELQLIYSKYQNVNDPLGFAHGDTVKYMSSEKSFMDAGGHMFSTQASLASGKSFTFEKVLPYSLADQAVSKGLDVSFNHKNDAAQLTNMYSLDIKSNPNAVKKAIMENGAVYAEYWYDSFSYNKEFNTYCSPDAEGRINHAITIVGWDDNISKTSFNEWGHPDVDGAWLIRNSWTTETSASEESYFYMSYDDPNLSNCYALEFDVNKYNHIYQHDASINTTITVADSAGNVFSMKNINKTNSQKLEAVMLYLVRDTVNTEQKCKIQVYTGIDDNSTPKSGYLHEEATTYFMLERDGIITVSLKEPVVLAPDEKFAIVITSLNGQFFVGLEESGSNYMGMEQYLENKPWYTTQVSVDAGESYYYYNGKWEDTVNYPVWKTDNETVKRGNLFIKGLVSDCNQKRYLINYKLNGGFNNDKNPSSYTTGIAVKLNTPKKNGYGFQGWYTDSKYQNKVSNISSTATGNKTLYAKWKINLNLKTGVDEYSGKPILKWDVVTDAKKYELYKATSKAGSYKRIASTTGRTYTDNKAVAGKRYYYKVKVTTKTGAVAYSNVQSLICSCEKPVLSVSGNTSTGKPVIYWGTHDSAKKYVLYRATSKKGTYKSIKTAYTEGKYIDSSAKPGKTYYYKLRLFTTKGNEGGSAYSNIYARTCDCAKPVVSIKRSSGKPKLTWKKVSGAGKYEIYRAVSKKGKYHKIYTTKNNYYTNKSAKKGKKYYYKVKAICSSNSKGNSAYSKIVSIKAR